MKVAVIGAGISGLACAYELQKAGAEVVVYEKNDYVGGRMATRVKDGFYFDIGADHLCNHYDDMKEYCQELGLEWEKMRFEKYGILKKGELIAPKYILGFWSKIRMGWQYFTLPKKMDFLDLNTAVQYDVNNAYDYMSARIGKEATDYLIDGFVSAYQFHRSSETSLGTLYAVMLSLKEKYDKWYLHRTKGGMSALPEALSAKLDVRLSQEAKRIKTDAATKKISVYSGEEEEKYDKVVLACQSPYALDLLDSPSEAQRNFLNSSQYAATISVSFRVEASLLQDSSVVWVPYVESRKIASFANQLMKGEQTQQGETALLSVWLHEEYAKALMDKSDDEIFVAVAQSFVDICPWFDSVDQLSAHDLQRWPLAEPKFYQGYLTQVKEFLDNEQGKDAVYFCGDYLNAPWTEGALRSGKKLAEVIINNQ